MDKKTFQALNRLLKQIGEMQYGDAYLTSPFDENRKNFADFKTVAKWIETKNQ